jgi:Ser/Thr protein kinase RdoA (MazF antagonist)
MGHGNTQAENLIREVGRQYDLPGEMAGVTQCTNGHINETYRVQYSSPSQGGNREFIFQKINTYVFREPVRVMRNIKEISLYMKSRKTGSDCDIITFLDNRDGENYTVVKEGFWRVCHYVDNSVTFETAEDLKVLRSAGYAFGRFQYLLSGFPMERLSETIPDFHHTGKRMQAFFEAVEQDPAGRSGQVQPEISFFRQHRDTAEKLSAMLDAGQLPLRVTHNDTKYNNILMDAITHEPLCVIDLDTVMPGLSMYDFGDAVRFAANKAVEDEIDLEKVGMDMDKYEAFTEGFMRAAREFLTPAEVEHMALGAIVITLELASRFMADYLNGDKYFRIHRPEHNADRARCQIHLAEDMLDRYGEMSRIVRQHA